MCRRKSSGPTPSVPSALGNAVAAWSHSSSRGAVVDRLITVTGGGSPGPSSGDVRGSAGSGFGVQAWIGEGRFEDMTGNIVPMPPVSAPPFHEFGFNPAGWRRYKAGP